MKLFHRFCLSAVLALSLAAPAAAEDERVNLACYRATHAPGAGDAPAPRQYAPEHEVQVVHLALDVTPDFEQRTVAGKATLQLRALSRPVREVKLDAVDLDVRSVTATAKLEAYQATADNIILTFAKPLEPDRQTSVTVTYRAQPREGLYFRTPAQGYKPGDTHLFTQGEEIEARNWYPCLDAPNVLFTSEIICHVPVGMTVISNGRLVSERPDAAGGLVAFHWSQEQPHANYLITLVAGYFKKLEAKHGGLPLTFYTPPSEIEEAETTFRDTPDMVAFFEQEIGVPYPWAKYAQVCVSDFVAEGMENTSATTLTDGALFTQDTENLRDSIGLVAHELAHQWFGDLVTCKDWGHAWLNEGFATYYAALYAEHKFGRDQLLYELYQRAREITSGSDETPIVRRNYEHPRDMFNYLAYPKAAWVLHMLRAQLGPDLYRRCVRTYLERHRHQNVVTEDLRSVIEELSGRSYDQFFDQWFYHGHFPELEVTYGWDESTKLAKVTIRQTQKLDDHVLLFRFPLPVRFVGPFGVVDHTFPVSKKEEDFCFPLASAPDLVRLDPDYTVLARLSFHPTVPMLRAQLTNQQDVIGRLLAIEQFGSRRDHEAIGLLQQTLNQDPFYGPRLEAARALRAIHTDETLEALLASTRQPDARVRNDVLAQLGGFYSERACAVARETLANEKNPGILATALADLAAYDNPATRELLLTFLGRPSFHNELADAAIAAMRQQDDPAYVPPLLEALDKSADRFTSQGFGQGLEVLACLTRNEEHKDTIRQFLLRYLNDKRWLVQMAAISALGALGDSKAIPALQTFTAPSRNTSQQSAADRAVASLHAARRAADDLRDLRQQVLELQKTNRELRKDVDDLKKALNTRPAPTPPAPAPPAKTPAAPAKNG